ncbi:conserved hypothetical protein [Pediculus humanus corporis]|uniref:C2H2-type domain-containing protein n=1 Tax=Pediculus humanus subsp. corporis TaxID=121224 RepID=E0VE89_PEDHC|nr:uncharacterized protein Phum_PHUM129180 [Pediculus humanus corporis]EEB11695.1 conserved hypothetical protein [Pediculus humanus corporis]
MENHSHKNINAVKNDEIKKKKFTCNVCDKNFVKKTALTVHLNSHNINNASNNMSDVIPNQEKDLENVCSVCFKKFTAKKNLMKHLRDVHKNFQEAERMSVKKIKCPENNCNFMCRMMKKLRNHIETCHKIKILKDSLEFSNEAEFLKWKKEEESNTVSLFVMGRKKTTLINGTKKQIFNCHRTGHYSPKGFGKYRMRSVGSCKIGVTCPAAMEVTEYLNGVLKVIYYKTHLGHLKDVVHLKLSKEERASLAEKIEQGFTFDSILEDIKEGINNDENVNAKRIHLLSKKDLYNIMRILARTKHKMKS